MSLHSQPSSQPKGFRSFKLSAVQIGHVLLVLYKSLDASRVLQQEYQKSNPALRAALCNAGIDLNTRLGLLLKYASNQLDEHHYHVLDSYNISCRSCWGPLDPADEYVGMVLYSKDRQTEWTANGVRVKSGYIYFKKTSDIKHIVSSQGQVWYRSPYLLEESFLLVAVPQLAATQRTLWSVGVQHGVH